MSKKVTQKKVKDVRKKEYYVQKDTFNNINKIVFPSDIQVGLDSSEFPSMIRGSIHKTREGKSYLVAGDGINILSSSNGQVTIDAVITTVEGPQGPQGDTGPTGLTGQTGPRGVPGTDGADGAGSATAVYSIDSSRGDVAVSSDVANLDQFDVPFELALVSNTNVVASNSHGVLTLGSAGIYSITVSMQVVQDGNESQSFILSLALNGSTLLFEDNIDLGGPGNTGSLLISNAMINTSSNGDIIVAQIRKKTSNPTHLDVAVSPHALATIRVEKLS